MAVARQRELALELGFVELLLDLEVKGGARQKTRRRQAVQRGGGRHHHHISASVLVMLADAPQRGQTLADQVLVRREGVKRQGFPVRKQHAAQLGRKKRHLVDQALRIGCIGGDDGRHLATGFVPQSQLGQQQRVGRASGAGQGEALARVKFG